MDDPLFDSREHLARARDWIVLGALASFAAWYNYATGALIALLLCMAGIGLAWRSWRLTGHRAWWVAPLLVVMVIAGAYMGPWLGIYRLLILPLLAGLVAAAVLALPVPRPGRRRPLGPMITPVSLALLVAATAAFEARTRASREATPTELASLAGCYSVERGLAFPGWGHDEWPPAETRVDTMRWTASVPRTGAAWNVIPVGIGAHMLLSTNSSGFWRPARGGGIDVNWSARGHVGFAGRLHARGHDLVGQGYWFQDGPGFSPTSRIDITLRRVPCDRRFPLEPVSQGPVAPPSREPAE